MNNAMNESSELTLEDRQKVGSGAQEEKVEKCCNIAGDMSKLWATVKSSRTLENHNEFKINDVMKTNP